MKARTKKGLIIISILIFVLVGAFILFYIIPNFFLKEDKIECEYKYAGTEDKDVFIFTFNKKGILTSYIKKEISVFKNKDEANKVYEILNKQTEDNNISVLYNSKKVEIQNENIVVASYEFIVDELNNKTIPTKDYILEEYRLYECKQVD